jgi:hypothetical protein
MPPVDIYEIVRQEILLNHALLHFTTVLVTILLLVGVAYVEGRQTVLAVLLPVLTISWAASVVRFDYLIHRQGAYLRAMETHLSTGTEYPPMWESWKASRTSPRALLPPLDVVAVSVVIVSTLYLLFGPSRAYFEANEWKGGRAYAWIGTAILTVLLLSLAAIPSIAAW